MVESTRNKYQVQAFVPLDAQADLTGKHASVYMTEKVPMGKGFRFQGYMWNIFGVGTIKEGVLTPFSVEFFAIYDPNTKFGDASFEKRKPSSTSSFRNSDYCDEDEYKTVRDDSSKRTQVSGNFSIDTSLYHVTYNDEIGSWKAEFTLRLQRAIFKQTSRQPSLPFYLYKNDVFDQIESQNFGKKFSELTEVIGEMWKSLDEERRSVYQTKYEELVSIYKESWKDPTRE